MLIFIKFMIIKINNYKSFKDLKSREENVFFKSKSLFFIYAFFYMKIAFYINNIIFNRNPM
jgi:hypothetical protein